MKNELFELVKKTTDAAPATTEEIPFSGLIIFGVIIFVLIIVFLSTIFIVRQQTVAIIERFGKYSKTKKAGIHIKAPFGIDKVVHKANLRVLQSNLKIEQKTKDNVFVVVDVAVQFRVNEQKIEDSYYKLQMPEYQIKAYVEDALRSSLPKYTLDESYEKKKEIAEDVFDTVSEEMTDYGYIIVKTLITSIEPDASVKEAMNEINSAQRQRVAAQELANADKIKVVTRAEAERDEMRLRGEGVAEQRRAITEGLTQSFEDLRKSGLDEKDIMSVLLMNQYLDTLNKFADKGNNTIFLPGGVTGEEDIRTQILSALAVKRGEKNLRTVKVKEEKNDNKES